MRKRILSLTMALALVLGLTLPAGAAGEETSVAASQPSADPETGFTDVSGTDYYADAVAWAVEEGGTQGTGNGAFSPDATVTRAEAVTFL